MSFLPAAVLVSAISLAAAEELAWLDLTGAAESLIVNVSAAAPTVGTVLRRRRGRPRKFAVPSRAVTLTLPEHVLETLTAIDPDPSRAVVRLAKLRGARVAAQPTAELSVFGNRAVITIKPTKSLEHHAGVDLLPLPDGRALISFEQAKTIADLELLLYDALESQDLPADDREIFEAIGKILKETRRSSDVAVLNRTVIVLESANGAAARKSAPRGRPHKGRKTRAL